MKPTWFARVEYTVSSRRQECTRCCRPIPAGAGHYTVATYRVCADHCVEPEERERATNRPATDALFGEVGA